MSGRWHRRPRHCRQRFRRSAGIKPAFKPQRQRRSPRYAASVQRSNRSAGSLSPSRTPSNSRALPRKRSHAMSSRPPKARARCPRTLPARPGATGETGAAATQVQVSDEALSQSAESLQVQVDSFLTGIRAAKAVAKQPFQPHPPPAHRRSDLTARAGAGPSRAATRHQLHRSVIGLCQCSG